MPAQFEIVHRSRNSIRALDPVAQRGRRARCLLVSGMNSTGNCDAGCHGKPVDLAGGESMVELVRVVVRLVEIGLSSNPPPPKLGPLKTSVKSFLQKGPSKNR